MWIHALWGCLLPLIGTTLGAACVFFLKECIPPFLHRMLCAFAAGVMCAAAVWSLLLPAIEQSAPLGAFAFLPAVLGFWAGVLLLYLLDQWLPDPKEQRSLLVLSVTLHNIPEGMAVGVIYAGFLLGRSGITLLAAVTLSLGIALQNIPEGAILSMPLYAAGKRKGRAFLVGMLSGVVEPIAAGLTILLMELVVPALPLLLGFAAGAMDYVVVSELLSDGAKDRRTPIAFSLGFTLMLILDVALG